MHYRNHNMPEVQAETLPENRPEAENNTENNSPFSGTMRPQPEDIQNTDFGLMQALYGNAAKKLLPHVKNAVADNMYEGSPLLRDIGPDRSCIDKITNEVLDSARAEFDDVDEICLTECKNDWDNSRLLRELTESMVLSEVFLNKRLKNGQN